MDTNKNEKPNFSTTNKGLMLLLTLGASALLQLPAKARTGEVFTPAGQVCVDALPLDMGRYRNHPAENDPYYDTDGLHRAMGTIPSPDGYTLDAMDNATPIQSQMEGVYGVIRVPSSGESRLHYWKVDFFYDTQCEVEPRVNQPAFINYGELNGNVSEDGTEFIVSLDIFVESPLARSAIVEILVADANGVVTPFVVDPTQDRLVIPIDSPVDITKRLSVRVSPKL
jgi:hypothetical protein